jgi:hypothetical protein
MDSNKTDLELKISLFALSTAHQIADGGEAERFMNTVIPTPQQRTFIKLLDNLLRLY